MDEFELVGYYFDDMNDLENLIEDCSGDVVYFDSEKLIESYNGKPVMVARLTNSIKDYYIYYDKKTREIVNAEIY